MITKRAYQFITAGAVMLLLFIINGVAVAQQTDTTNTTEKLKKIEQPFPQPYHSERSTDSFLLPSSGTYGVPEPTEYYTPPFKGQEYLDYAVEAYREELENSITNTLLFQVISKIAPFVNNQFEFGVYRIYDLPIVERDHPLLYPQNAPEKKNR